jgi:hypothetical protein
MKTKTLFSAGALLGTSVLAIPTPQESSPEPDLGPEDFQVVPYQDIQPSTIIKTSSGEFTIESRLTEFRGCGDNKSAVVTAFADAIKIVNSVGNPHYVIGYPTDGNHEAKGKEV